jgi:hypothetical protein
MSALPPKADILFFSPGGYWRVGDLGHLTLPISVLLRSMTGVRRRFYRDETRFAISAYAKLKFVDIVRRSGDMARILK